MSELIGANWWLIVLALVVGLAVAWWIFVGSRRTKVELDKRDTLDEGADKARRNQALIDAPAKPEAILAAPPPPPPPAAPPPAAKAPEPVPVVEAKPVSPPPAPAPTAKKAKPAPKKVAPAKEKPKPAPVAAKKPAARKPAAKKPTAKKPAAKRPTPPPPIEETVELPPPVPEGLAGVGIAIQAEAAPAPAPHHDLSLLKGVGPKLVVMLHQLGITGFDDIAGWSEADIDRIDAQLEQFQGRIRRDNWVDQAKLLAAGDIAGFEARYGKI